MFARVQSIHYQGLESYKVDVEIDIVAGLPSFSIVGLPDAAIKESKERVRSAVQNSEFDFPLRKITVNLAPAELKKEGPSFDLPIAIALLRALGCIKNNTNDYYFVGELSLMGKVRSISGALLLAEKSKNDGKKIVLPAINADEAALIKGVEIIPVTSLTQVVSYLNGEEKIGFSPSIKTTNHLNNYSLDLKEVKGQTLAKRALEISAAGGHNVLMTGSPGAGKSMLAKRLPTIMPPLTDNEMIETTKVYSVAGLTNNGRIMISKRPFRSPHHTISSASMVGGGPYPKPGEISLSHLGVLFLDEFTEFRRDALEALRQPLEERIVSISRVQQQLTYPANFCLIAAMNPCKCGYYGDSVKQCICTPYEVRRYRQKLSGPLLERIDLHVNVQRLTKEELNNYQAGEASSSVRKRVTNAYKIQQARFKDYSINKNSEMSTRHLQKYCKLDKSCLDFLGEAVDKLGLSGRSYDKILRISRTIADLNSNNEIKIEHLAEAIQFRQYDRQKLL